LHDDTAQATAAAAALSKDLEAQWAKRIAVMQALGRYASALASLVDAGGKGSENILAFADALKGLAGAAGVVAPQGAAVEAALQLAERAYQEIARGLAANQLYQIVEKADPAITGLAAIISEDLSNLRSVALEKRRTALTQLARNDLVAQLSSFRVARAQAAQKALDPQHPDSAALDQLKRLNDAYAMIGQDPEYVQLENNRADVERLFHAQTELLDQAAATLLAWGAAHHELVLGLREKHAPSLDELSRFTTDLYSIYINYRKARSQP
jgi:hypothetical protein